MTSNITAAIRRLTAWNTGDTDAIPEAYTHDALTFQQDLRRVLTLAEQALRLREAARVVVEAFTDPDPTIGEIAEIETLRAALDQAPGDGE